MAGGFIAVHGVQLLLGLVIIVAGVTGNVLQQVAYRVYSTAIATGVLVLLTAVVGITEDSNSLSPSRRTNGTVTMSLVAIAMCTNVIVEAANIMHQAIRIGMENSTLFIIQSVVLACSCAIILLAFASVIAICHCTQRDRHRERARARAAMELARTQHPHAHMNMNLHTTMSGNTSDVHVADVSDRMNLYAQSHAYAHTNPAFQT